MTVTRRPGVRLVRGPFLRLEPHEDHCETEAELAASAPDPPAGPRPLLAADLFSGAGGLSLGLEQAGSASSSGQTTMRRRLRPTATTWAGWRSTGTSETRTSSSASRASSSRTASTSWPAAPLPALLQGRSLGDAIPGEGGSARPTRLPARPLAVLPGGRPPRRAARGHHGERPRHGTGP